MHLNTLYRIQDPYHNSTYIDFLPKVLSFADIATLSDQSEIWKPLLSPVNADVPPCFAMSFVFTHENVKHRFVFYYVDWKDLIHFHVNLINLPQQLTSVINILKSVMLKNFTPFFIPKDRLNSLNLNYHTLSLSDGNDLLNIKNSLNNNELNLLKFLAFGVNKTVELSERLDVSVRTVEDYTQNIRKKLKLVNRYELYDYARKFQILVT
ncbi:LuxR C-terminal-related transcriptional regulator [Fangia hongkongensis]|uniref:LuxR C-terminal-related transcriptional regulator n=2 Tax=Fangia hongkongensis TaxID=270495 RepID=UPI000375D4B4|nr:LuxR C-terminal-related transcriptional regulator [Fangia hongkongensis]